MSPLTSLLLSAGHLTGPMERRRCRGGRNDAKGTEERAEFNPPRALAGSLGHLYPPWPHLVWRPSRAFGVFPRRVRHPPTLVRRPRLRRPGCAVPVSARAGIESGRHRDRAFAGRLLWRACGLGRIHAALCGGAGAVRLWRDGARRCVGPRLDSRAKGGGSRGGCAGNARP
jgi:hypothetical protein